MRGTTVGPTGQGRAFVGAASCTRGDPPAGWDLEHGRAPRDGPDGYDTSGVVVWERVLAAAPNGDVTGLQRRARSGYT